MGVLANRGLLAGLLLLALALRIGALWLWGGAPPEKDALEYHSIAMNMLSGFGYSIQADVPTSLRPPVYPTFLAAVYSLFGPEYRHVLYVQALMHALLVLPLYWLGKRLSGSSVVGLLAAALFAVHPSFEIISRLYAENLLVPLLLLFLFLMQQAMSAERHGLIYALGAGLTVGLMGLTKPEYGLLGLGCLLLALLWSESRRYWGRWLAVTLISVCMLGAWQVRNINIDVSQDHQLAREAFVFANCPAMIGDGWWSVTDMQELERQRTACHAYLDTQPMAEQSMSVKEMWFDRPWLMTKLVLSRVMILWASPPVGISQITDISVGLKWLAILAQFAFVGLAFAALLRLVPVRPELFSFLAVAVYMTIVYGLLHAIRRYGYPFVPELCLMFSYGLLMLYEKWKNRKGA